MPSWNCATGSAPAPRTASPNLKDLGARNLPLRDLAQNKIWLATVLLGQQLLTWTATLALDTHRAAVICPAILGHGLLCSHAAVR